MKSRTAKVALACEVMRPPYDEGVRIYAASLARALGESSETLLLSEAESRLDGRIVHGALTNRYFMGRDLRRLLRRFGPDVVIYVPWTSLTARTLVRVGSLRRHAPGAAIGVVSLQPRPADPLTRLAARLARPDIVFVCGPGAEAQARRIGLRPLRAGCGVDRAKFSPAAPGEREALRRRAGIPSEACVVLHVGHLKETRNVAVMERVARIESVTAMMVASTSTRTEQAVAERLRDAGVLLMTRHQDRIELAYRMADAYLFPVTSPLDAIETPLSVLEAAACDLAIIATPFGGLPDLLSAPPDSRTVIWARDDEEMVSAVRRLAALPPAGRRGGTRRLTRGLGWDAIAAGMVEALVRASGLWEPA